jgi:hypothetical protein
MKRFINWLTHKISPRLRQTGSHLRYTGGHTAPRKSQIDQALPKQQPEYVDIDPHFDGTIEDNGPGKNVLIRNKFVREDTGTHETLKILDDSMIDTQEEEGIDPYNTGRFDRSRNWDKRRK